MNKGKLDIEDVDYKLTILRKETASYFKGFIESPLFLSVLIAVVTGLVFIRVLNADFVMFDDDWCIYKNPTLGGLSLKNLSLIFTNKTVSSSWYTPLTGLRWCITYHFCQLNPFGYHLGNWLFHIADAVLVFLVLRKLLLLGFSRRGDTEPWRLTVCAAIGALLFSLHPLRVEVVAWAAGAYGQALLFLLISLLCYLRANQKGVTVLWRRGLLVISLVSYVASLLSQPFGLSFLIVLVILDVYPLGRIGGNRGWFKTAEVRSVLFEKLAFAVAALIFLLVNVVLRMHSTLGAHKAVSLAEFGLIERFMQAMYIWAYYIWRPWYPVKLAPVYTTLVSFNPLSLPFIASAVAVIVGTVKLWHLRGRWPIGLALGVCHLALLVPVLGLFEHPYYSGDRYSLIVSIGWSVLLAAWLASPKTRRSVRAVIITVSIVIISTLGILTFQQTQIWDNSAALFKHVIRNLGDDPYRRDIHWRLGAFYLEQGDTSKAIEQFQKTLEIAPSHHKAHDFLARILAQQGRICEAVKHFEQVLQVRPDDFDILNNISWMLAVYKDSRCYNPARAIQLGQRACELTSYNNPVILDTLAAAYAAAGRYSEAIDIVNRALEITRDSKQQELTKNFQELLLLYKANQPYIEPLPKILSD